MPVTTLSFFRKRQTLDNLEIERPQSLLAVRQALHLATDFVETQLEQIERAFYGNGHRETEIRKWAPILFNIMKATDTPEVSQLRQFNAMMEKATDPVRKFEIDSQSVQIVKDCIKKIFSSTPDMFFDVIDQIMKIHKYLQKYCLSFCSLKRTDSYLETALHYELKRRELSETINATTNAVVLLGKAFKDTGLDTASFSLNTKEMARRCDCATIPFVLIFPESCEKIRMSCKAIRQWLEADEQYMAFLENDICDLEAKQGVCSKLVREGQERIFQLEYRMRHAKKESAEIELDVEKLIRRNASIQDHEAKVLADYNSMKMELEIKEFRKVELRNKAAIMKPAEYNEANDRLINEMNALKERMNATSKAVEHIQLKMRWIEERRDKVNVVNEKLSTVRKELKKARSENKKQEIELDRINECLALLKKIHILKSSSDVLKKIFLNLPLVSNAEQVAKRKTDVLDRSFRVVSRYIEQDWMKLYRALPFFPNRGEEQLAMDLDQVDKSHVRGNIQELCLESLRRWRRVHTRATLDDLKQSLADINRKDVLQSLLDAMNPKPKPKPMPRSQRRPLLKKVFAF